MPSIKSSDPGQPRENLVTVTVTMSTSVPAGMFMEASDTESPVPQNADDVHAYLTAVAEDERVDAWTLLGDHEVFNRNDFDWEISISNGDR